MASLPDLLPDLDLSDYPRSDGLPVGENLLHTQNIWDIIAQLKQHFVGQQVLLGSNQFIYYEKNDRRRHVSPDVYVKLDHSPDLAEGVYFLWLENGPPDVVIEIASEATIREDMVDKFRIYQNEIGVPEYFLFDPHDEFRSQRLMGYRLVNGKYVAIAEQDERLFSERLGLWPGHRGSTLRLWVPGAAEPLRSSDEQARLLEAQDRQLRAERQARQAAERELARLQDELRRLKGEPPA